MSETQTAACPRIKAKAVWGLLPARYYESLEQNQQIASCCRHPENHDIEARYSDAAAAESKAPDIYIFHCTCGRRHQRFVIGGSKGFKRDGWGFVLGEDGKPAPYEEPRPFWEVR
jgi:hypothetical protein